MARVRAAGAEATARRMVSTLRVALQRHNCFTGPEASLHKEDGLEVWQAYLPTHAHFDSPLAGDWRIGSYWRYIEDPDTRVAELYESSVALMVSGHPLEGVGFSGDSVCLVRYDFDSRDDPTSHLNVLQPSPMRDGMHWRLPTGTSQGWDCDMLVDYLFSRSVTEDLRRRCGWPLKS